MNDTNVTDTPNSLIAMTTKKLLFTAVIGAAAGLTTWGLTLVFDMYIYKTILCNGSAAVQCSSSYQYATTTATIVGAAAGLFGLVKFHVFRPLLIVIASFVSLWGLLALVADMAWYWAVFAVILLYGLSFGLFAWVARVRRFYIALIAVVLIVIAVRLVLNR
jgi:hypothetical protein